jgi:hypothetical protein
MSTAEIRTTGVLQRAKIDRRRFLFRAATAAITVAAACRAQWIDAADDEKDPETTAANLLTPTTRKAIDRGLAFLASRQQEDGSMGPSGYSHNPGVCGLASMAFLANGSTPGRGKYGKNIDRIVGFVLSQADESGFISIAGSSSHGPMYGHGFATLFLAECYGMTGRKEIREKLSRAVQLIIDTQNQEGGWRYQPIRYEADISVTICQVMALRAARNAGLYVPQETIARAVDYVKRSQNADGGFMYMLSTGGPSQFPRSAAGVVALYSAGIYEGKHLEDGLNYLMQHIPRGDEFSRETHYFYGHYYAVQAMWHAGGERWAKWYPAIRDALLKRQSDDGSWSDSISVEYGTAMACLILQMPNNYLPIFQR